MKKQILLIGTFLTFGVGFSQNVFPTAAGTNVGIGTSTPGNKLHILTTLASGVSGLRLGGLDGFIPTSNGNGRVLGVNALGDVSLYNLQTLYTADGTIAGTATPRIVTMNSNHLIFRPSTVGNDFFINGSTGNIGLGTTTPSTKLDIIGVAKANQGVFSSSYTNTTPYSFTSVFDRNDKCTVLSAGNSIGTGTGYVNTRMFNFYDFPISNFDTKSTVFFGIEDRGDVGRYRFIAQALGSTQMIMNNKSQQEIMKIYDDGSDNVTMTLPKANSFLGIGTTSFTDGVDTYRISVKGAIRADRVKVYTTWADYVFEKSYILPTLAEVEKQIQEKGHLKDIPSSKEVENNGIELGEMNKRLLQKIEELTLYIIQLNKDVQGLKSQINK